MTCQVLDLFDIKALFEPLCDTGVTQKMGVDVEIKRSWNKFARDSSMLINGPVINDFPKRTILVGTQTHERCSRGYGERHIEAHPRLAEFRRRSEDRNAVGDESGNYIIRGLNVSAA